MDKYQLDDCRKFAKHNLIECAKELLEWQDTGVLRTGKVRELAKMFGTLHENLSLAKAVISREILETFVEDFCVLSMEKSLDGSSTSKCPVCDRHGVVFFDKPINYWCCKLCGNVFVLEEAGLIGVLDDRVRYHSK